MTQIYDLRVDGMATDTMSRLCPGVISGASRPVFSWRLSEGVQRGCRVVVASEQSKLSTPDLWDSGWSVTRNSLSFVYAGIPLISLQHAYFQVSVELDDGRRIESDPFEFTIGLLSAGDWSGKWLCADGFEHLVPAPAPYFRRRFQLSRPLRQALLFSTAKGLLELMVNGKRVDEHDFLPGWSDFRRHLQYTAYDVTHLLRDGDNLLGAILGDGWYVTSFPGYRRNVYGMVPSFRLQLELGYDDGSSERVVTDRSWRWNYGPILSSDIYEGESYDGRREMLGWCEGDFEDSSWREALELPDGDEAEKTLYVRKKMPGVVRKMVLEPIERREPTAGVWIYDFGRVVTGRVRLTCDAPPNAEGLQARISYAEVLNSDGSLYNVNFRNALNRDSCVVRAGRNEWESRFTFHGFRYVQLENLPIQEFGVKEIQLQAVVLTSDIAEAGTFSCGFQPLNQLAENIRSSMRGNLLEVPMDCPQRDERLGWTGDALYFFPTAMLLGDCRSFFSKYLQDLRYAQREDGAVSSVAPVIPGFLCGSPGYADALPLITWGLFRQSGDVSILEENYDAIRRHLEYELAKSEDLILVGHLDHLSSSKIKTDTRLIGTVFLWRTAEIMAMMAKRLARSAEVEEYSALASRIRKAIHANFLTNDGVLKNQTQCGFALLFYFGLFDTDEQRKANAECFKKLVRDNGNHLDTGFIGTAYLCPALAKAGLSDVACDLVLQRDYPSWLFEVDNGATTIWERWDSYHPEKGFATPVMNSFNHYANGAVGEFLFAYLGGISFQAVDDDGNVAPRVIFHVIPDSRIGSASFSLNTPCGEAISEWRLDGRRLYWRMRVPPNAIGIVEERGGEPLAPGEYNFTFDIYTK